MKAITKNYISKLVHAAIDEDIGSGDITAELVSKTKKISGHILCRERATICGTKFVDEVFRQLDNKIKLEWLVHDGDAVKADQILCFFKGPARPLLSGERTAINFLQTLSGVATTTKIYVDAIANEKTQLLDTRKTIPLLRIAEKYAVACGGGKNHRLGLFDAYLIKENHLAAMNCSIKNAIKAARKNHPEKQIEIEVKNLTELEEAINANADLILLDNFNLKNTKAAVKINNNRAKLESSGGIYLKNIMSYAKTGVDFISVGALTKNIKAIDLSMLFDL